MKRRIICILMGLCLLSSSSATSVYATNVQQSSVTVETNTISVTKVKTIANGVLGRYQKAKLYNTKETVNINNEYYVADQAGYVYAVLSSLDLMIKPSKNEITINKQRVKANHKLLLPSEHMEYKDFKFRDLKETYAIVFKGETVGLLFYVEKDKYDYYCWDSNKAKKVTLTATQVKQKGFTKMISPKGTVTAIEDNSDHPTAPSVDLDTKKDKYVSNEVKEGDKVVEKATLYLKGVNSNVNKETLNIVPICKGKFRITKAVLTCVTNGNTTKYTYIEGNSATDDWKLCILNGIEYKCTENGTYYVEFVASNDKETTRLDYDFIIDTKAPTIKGVKNGASYNKQFNITVSDNVELKEVLYDNEKAGNMISVGVRDKEGTHNIVATDNVGNTTKISFSIDRTGPKITGVKQGVTYKKAKTIKIADKAGLKHVTVNGVDLDDTKLAKISTNGYTVAKDGFYTVKATDFVGNTSTVTFKLRIPKK